MNTVTALYDTRGAAETARTGLIDIGVNEADITIRGTDDRATAETTETQDKGFWASLGDLFMPDEDRYTYSEGMRRGGYLLTANVAEGMSQQAEQVLESADPVDLDERSSTWRSEGWTGYSTGTTGSTDYAAGAAATTGYDTGAAGTSGTTGYGTGAADTSSLTGTGTTGSTATTGYDTGAADTSSMTGAGVAGSATTGAATSAGRAASDDETLQVVDEELRVGKRQTGGGRVRVSTYDTERPVNGTFD